MTVHGDGPTAVRVALADDGYDVVVGAGLLANAGVLLAEHLPRHRTAIVTDETVASLHGPSLSRALDAAQISHQSIVLEPGEQTKDFAHLEDLVDQLLAAQIERGDAILALGGGVIGDLAGFAASILRRGVGIIQIPTTLLAQVDSGVGGKTAINSRHAKNLIGTFHQPKLVIADVATLTTLPPRERRAGYAEIVKYGVLGDRALFEWLGENGGSVIAGDAAAQQRAVVASVRAKAGIVARDEREAGDRVLLNLGHTFAHALETEAGYGEHLRHGEAVAVGMVLALALSVRLGHCPRGDYERLRAHLAAVGLPVAIADVAGPGWSSSALISHMRQDKKSLDGDLRFVLVRRIGEAFVRGAIDEALLREILESSLEDVPTTQNRAVR